MPVDSIMVPVSDKCSIQLVKDLFNSYSVIYTIDRKSKAILILRIMLISSAFKRD